MGAIPIVARHAADHVSFLGSDPDYYAAVFPIERIADFARTVQEIIGRPLMVPRAQNYGPKFDASMLSLQVVAAIRRHYERGYDIWGRHF